MFSSVDEYLDVEGTGEHAVGGDLCKEYLLVVTGHTVGVSVEDEPSTSDGVIDEESCPFSKLAPHGLTADSMVLMFPSPAAASSVGPMVAES